MKTVRLISGILGCLLFADVMAMDIYLESDGKESVIQLNESEEAKDFLKMLPLELTFEDYGVFERISYLPKKLNLAAEAKGFTPLTGDLTYFAPWGNLAVFIKDFRPSSGLYSLGTLSPEALQAVKESDNKKVRLFVKDKK